MEDLNPTLRLVLNLKYRLESGDSVRSAIRRHLAGPADSWTAQLNHWWSQVEKGETNPSQKIKASAHRRILLSVLESGLRGEPILKILSSLEVEIVDQSQIEIDRFIGRLPVLMMIPVFLFMFPSLLMVLLGPLLMQLVSQFNG